MRSQVRGLNESRSEDNLSAQPNQDNQVIRHGMQIMEQQRHNLHVVKVTQSCMIAYQSYWESTQLLLDIKLIIYITTINGRNFTGVYTSCIQFLRIALQEISYSRQCYLQTRMIIYSHACRINYQFSDHYKMSGNFSEGKEMHFSK